MKITSYIYYRKNKSWILEVLVVPSGYQGGNLLFATNGYILINY